MRIISLIASAAVVLAVLVGGVAATAVVAAPSAFPGANGKLVLTASPLQFESFIHVVNADGSGRTQVAFGYAATWSPDGSKLALGRRDGAEPRDYELWTVNLVGSGSRRLTTNDDDDNLPSWSPDGASIVFTRTDPDSFGFVMDLYRIDADGTNEIQLTSDPGSETNPAWSPDGTKIAFSSNRTGTQEIYVMATDGSAVTRLTTNAVNDWMGDWSPDGARIVFQRNDVVLPDRDIWTMRADGTDERQLTSGPEQDQSPDWSPDGTKIAFARWVDAAAADIHTMNVDGTGIAQIAYVTDEGLPDWQRLQPTGVSVRSLAARRLGRSVVVSWRAAPGFEAIAFNVYRERDGRRVKLRTLVPRAAISAVAGGRHYSWRDRGPGRLPRYFLEEIQFNGARVWHGPVAPARA